MRRNLNTIVTATVTATIVGLVAREAKMFVIDAERSFSLYLVHAGQRFDSLAIDLFASHFFLNAYEQQVLGDVVSMAAVRRSAMEDHPCSPSDLEMIVASH